MIDLQKLVPKLLASVFEDRRQRAVAERNAAVQLKRGATNLHLLCDTLKGMGVDVATPTGKVVLGRLLKIAAIRKELSMEDDMQMPHSFIGEGFGDL